MSIVVFIKAQFIELLCLVYSKEYTTARVLIVCRLLILKKNTRRQQ